MGELVNLGQVRKAKAARRAFAHWPRRLAYTPESGVKAGDLPDAVLYTLASLESQATLALYDVVLGARDLGPGERLSELDSATKFRALDDFLFLADQMRFELMRRLGWVGELPAKDYGLLDLVFMPAETKTKLKAKLPSLGAGFPHTAELDARHQLEPATAVRSLIPQALEEFGHRL